MKCKHPFAFRCKTCHRKTCASIGCGVELGNVTALMCKVVEQEKCIDCQLGQEIDFLISTLSNTKGIV